MRKLISVLIAMALLLGCAFAESIEEAQALTITVSDIVFTSDGVDYPLGDVKGLLSYRWEGPTMAAWENMVMDMHVEKGDQILFPIQALATPDMNMAMRFGESNVYAFDFPLIYEGAGLTMPDTTAVSQEEMQTWAETYLENAKEILALGEPVDTTVEAGEESFPAKCYTFHLDGENLAALLENLFDTHPNEGLRSLKDMYMELIGALGLSADVEIVYTEDQSRVLINLWDDVSAINIAINGSSADVAVGLNGEVLSFKVAWEAGADFTDNISGIEPIQTYSSMDDFNEGSAGIALAVMTLADDLTPFIEDEQAMAFYNVLFGVSEDYYTYDCSVEELPFTMPAFNGVPEGYTQVVDVCYAYKEDATGVCDMHFEDADGNQFSLMVNNYTLPEETAHYLLTNGKLEPVAEPGTVITADGSPAYFYQFYRNGLSFSLYDYSNLLTMEQVAAFIEGIE